MKAISGLFALALLVGGAYLLVKLLPFLLDLSLVVLGSAFVIAMLYSGLKVLLKAPRGRRSFGGRRRRYVLGARRPSRHIGGSCGGYGPGRDSGYGRRLSEGGYGHPLDRPDSGIRW